jgi:flavin-dependent dehydrogenase
LKLGGGEAIVLDKHEFPRLKLCAGWITPKVIRDIQMDVDSYPHSLVRFDRLNFHIRGFRLPVRTRQYSIRRVEFDHWLLKRSGVPVFHHAARDIRREDGHYFIDDAYQCKVLVGAGGTYCPVYRSFFEQINPRAYEQKIVCMEQEFPHNLVDEQCHLWFFDRKLTGYSWYVPKGSGYLNVGIGGKFAGIKSRGESIRDHWQHFVQKLADLSLVPDYAFQPKGYQYYLRQNVEQVQLDKAFIIGDAAGLATKDMGEGIGPAIESGIAAANAIIHGSDLTTRKITKYSLPGILLPQRS